MFNSSMKGKIWRKRKYFSEPTQVTTQCTTLYLWHWGCWATQGHSHSRQFHCLKASSCIKNLGFGPQTVLTLTLLTCVTWGRAVTSLRCNCVICSAGRRNGSHLAGCVLKHRRCSGRAMHRAPAWRMAAISSLLFLTYSSQHKIPFESSIMPIFLIARESQKSIAPRWGAQVTIKLEQAMKMCGLFCFLRISLRSTAAVTLGQSASDFVSPCKRKVHLVARDPRYSWMWTDSC